MWFLVCRNLLGFITTVSAVLFSRTEDAGLFGNMWFKSLAALQLGKNIMQKHDVFHYPRHYADVQKKQMAEAGHQLGLRLVPSDVYLLATAKASADTDPALANYLRRPPSDPTASLRVCLTPGMAEKIGTAGPVRALRKAVDASLERTPK